MYNEIDMKKMKKIQQRNGIAMGYFTLDAGASSRT